MSGASMTPSRLMNVISTSFLIPRSPYASDHDDSGCVTTARWSVGDPDTAERVPRLSLTRHLSALAIPLCYFAIACGHETRNTPRSSERDFVAAVKSVVH